MCPEFTYKFKQPLKEDRERFPFHIHYDIDEDIKNKFIIISDEEVITVEVKSKDVAADAEKVRLYYCCKNDPLGNSYNSMKRYFVDEADYPPDEVAKYCK